MMHHMIKLCRRQKVALVAKMASALSAPLTCPLAPWQRSKTRNHARCDLEVKERRSASYHPTIWETKHIQSFVTPYSVSLIV